MNNKYDNFLEKFQNQNSFKEEIEKIYLNDYNDLVEDILLKKDSDFIKTLFDYVKISLKELYSSKIFKNVEFIMFIKNIETNFYKNIYLKEKNLFEKTLNYKNIDFISNGEIFNFLKHCKNQEKIPLHSCNKSNNFILVFKEKNNNKINDEIFGIICTNCKKVYKSNIINLYCNHCNKNYYTKIIYNKDFDSNLQPCTWEKYHCNLIYNNQMQCIKCKSNFYLNLEENKLICLNCKFECFPNELVWICVKCGQEFKSDVKIYNPNEYKPIQLCIKKALYEKKFVPNELPCGHDPNYIVHNKNCDGKLLKGELNGKKMIVCKKCHVLSKYEKFNFECPICGLRFKDTGDNKKNKVQFNNYNEDDKNYQKKLYINRKYSKSLQNLQNIHGDNEIYENDNNDNNKNKNKIKTSSKDKNFFHKKTSSSDINDFDDSIDNSNKNTKINPISISKEFFIKKAYTLSKKKSKILENENENPISKYHNLSKKNPLKKRKSNIIVPIFDTNDYEIISQVGSGRTSKVYCCKLKNENEFFALKKKTYLDKNDLELYLYNYAVQYSFLDNPNILNVYYINVSEGEASCLMELGINNWDSEIATLKKMKKFYTENELVDIIYQISIALEALQKRQLAHFNVEPKNIIVFKDKKYKINDFNEIKEVYNDDSNENNFNVNNLIPNENRFISPNLLDYFEKKCKKVDLVKNDVYSLGLCVMYSIKNDINLINKDFTMINNYNNNSGIINKNVENYFYYAEQLSKNHYSNKLKNLVKNMLNVNEHLRFDFTEIINDINEEYK